MQKLNIAGQRLQRGFGLLDYVCPEGATPATSVDQSGASPKRTTPATTMPRWAASSRRIALPVPRMGYARLRQPTGFESVQLA